MQACPVETLQHGWQEGQRMLRSLCPGELDVWRVIDEADLPLWRAVQHLQCHEVLQPHHLPHTQGCV